MFFHILKRDLKRKKTMNIILLLFIILATMFLSSSVNNLVAVSGAIDHFMEISKVPDFMIVALTDGKEDAIEDFLKKGQGISEYETLKGLTAGDEQITITECGQQEEKTIYEKTNTLMIQAVSEDFLKVFVMGDGKLPSKSGEIAIPKLEADNNSLQVGDKLSIKIEEVEQEFTVTAIVKDAAFGTSFMGFKRLMISQEDFEKYSQQENLVYVNLYNINYQDEEAFQNDWKKCNFSTISSVEKDTFKMCYVMDMLMAGVLIVVSVCLILISILVLRFTIVFTLQEDYKEIGIMKALGMKDRGIKGLYLVKYTALSIVGATIGFFLSIPFGDMLLQQVIVNIEVEKAEQNFMINLLFAILIVGIVLLFCNSGAGKLKKFSAMDAIRSGSDGERFRANNHLRLWKRTQMKPYFYLALNDIFSSMKRFGILAVTFCLGTMLILLPLSAVSTLKDDSIISIFSMCPSDAYVDNGKAEQYIADKDRERVLADLQEMEDTLLEHGIVALTGVDMGYNIPCYSNDPEELFNYFALQEMGNWDRHYKVLEGREPELPNEMMITELTAEKMGVEIGDSIYFNLSEGTKDFIITGTFQSLMNLGMGYRMSRSAQLDESYYSGIFSIQVEVEDMESEEVVEKLKEIFPDYKVYNNAREFINRIIGDLTKQMDVMILFIAGIVLLINSLITVLLMKTIMTKEQGDIALLKSIGFADRAVRGWQMARIMIILVMAILMGTVLSNLSAPFVMGPIFAMMGANKIDLIMNPLEAYVLYPLLLLTVTGISAYICAGAVKKVDLKEVNTME